WLVEDHEDHTTGKTDHGIHRIHHGPGISLRQQRPALRVREHHGQSLPDSGHGKGIADRWQEQDNRNRQWPLIAYGDDIWAGWEPVRLQCRLRSSATRIRASSEDHRAKKLNSGSTLRARCRRRAHFDQIGKLAHYPSAVPLAAVLNVCAPGGRPWA